MKKLLTLMVVLAWGAVASVAQAQDKKNYIIGSLGVYASSGEKNVTDYPSGDVHEHKGRLSEDGNNFRIGFGSYVNQSLSLEFAIVDFGDFKGTDRDTDCNNGNCETTLSEYKAKLDVYDVSAVFYKPLNEKANLTFRGGFANYSWSVNGRDIDNIDGINAADMTLLLGVGAEFGDIHVELRSYDLTYHVTGVGEYYTTPIVLSVGYKAHF